MSLKVGIYDANDLLLPLTLLFILAALIAGDENASFMGTDKLSYAIGADISCEIYKRTLYQPYKIHMERNSSEIIAGISTKANQAVYGQLNPY